MTASSGRPTVGRRLLRVLTTLLVAVAGGLMVRPLLLLLAVPGQGSVPASTALVALAYHSVVLVLAVTLWRRTR